jgi:hypothetical protein
MPAVAHAFHAPEVILTFFGAKSRQPGFVCAPEGRSATAVRALLEPQAQARCENGVSIGE